MPTHSGCIINLRDYTSVNIRMPLVAPVGCSWFHGLGLCTRKSRLRPMVRKMLPGYPSRIPPIGNSSAGALMPQRGATVWTIYCRPSDYPGRWAMRGYEIVPGVGVPRHDAYFVATTLEEIRSKVPPGTCRVGRAPEDHPVIYECWVTRRA